MRTKLMYKPKTKVEKICRWTLYSLMLIFTSYMLHLRYNVYYDLNKSEFVKQVWGNGNYFYLIAIIIVFVFLYVRSNLTEFKSKL
jgi:hypothetical protein